jgi:Domain of unknown function (DUF4157)
MKDQNSPSGFDVVPARGRSAQARTPLEARDELPIGAPLQPRQDGSRNKEIDAMLEETVNTAGQPLDQKTRALLEPRFGHDFSKVRVHSDLRAAQSARGFNAVAYTIGTDIVFDQGRYQPHQPEGERLLAHELTHVVQQSKSVVSAPSSPQKMEREAEQWSHDLARNPEAGRQPISGAPISVARQTNAQSTSRDILSLEEFVHTMIKKYGVSSVHIGTEAEQKDLVTPKSGVPQQGIKLPGWKPWKLDPNVLKYIVDSFDDFDTGIGGVPAVQEIVFFDVDYSAAPSGIGTPIPENGASYSAGKLTIFSSASRRAPLPVGRSVASGRYQTPVAVVTGIPGQTPGAPLAVPSEEENVHRNITHELGHGLEEAAANPFQISAADPKMLEDYRAAVGWTKTDPARLFDIQDPAVAAAIQSGSVPTAKEIIESNWNSPQWGEQPLTVYSVTGGPFEDFAEATMAFVNAPNLLLARSPHRFQFLNERKSRWLSRLRKPPKVGDFPMPPKDRAIG